MGSSQYLGMRGDDIKVIHDRKAEKEHLDFPVFQGQSRQAHPLPFCERISFLEEGESGLILASGSHLTICLALSDSPSESVAGPGRLLPFLQTNGGVSGVGTAGFEGPTWLPVFVRVVI